MNFHVVLVLGNNLKLVVKFQYCRFYCFHPNNLIECHGLFSIFIERLNNLKFNSSIDYMWLERMNDII
jgi:hypothetical protein